MNLDKITEKCSKLAVYEKRSNKADYMELVFYNNQMDEWNKAFTDMLGSPVKPAGKPPTKEDIRLTSSYGGIYENQTLFKKDFGGTIAIAMFWPWQDNEHTTLKVAFIKEG